MGLVDRALGPIRSALGTAEHEAEHEVERALPVGEVEGIQKQILEGMNALRHTTESIEAHVAVVETLAAALPPMTDAVTALTVRLGELLEVLAPIAAVERELAGAERDVARATHFFKRRQRATEAPPAD
jgi:hypothetical protein